VAELTGCTEKEAQAFLQIPAAEAQQKIVPLAQKSGIDGFALKELSEGIENYYCDRGLCNRLIPILTLNNPRSPNRGARWT
jgi:hypothetical protein